MERPIRRRRVAQGLHGVVAYAVFPGMDELQHFGRSAWAWPSTLDTTIDLQPTLAKSF